MNFKILAFLLSIGSLGEANPIEFAQNDQIPFRQTETMCPYELDMNSLRLVQLEGKDPVWMTENEKVGFSLCGVLVPTDHWPATKIQVKAQGFKFFDMWPISILVSGPYSSTLCLVPKLKTLGR